uniref:Uncharacterized protein n=1 Tax=Panagrolaimus sp. PS1159 TaxID=55785 RepID=A0AC35GPM9_9BILA
MESEETLITTIYYYIRESFYGTALISCEEGCKRYRENHEYICLKAYCLSKLGKSPEAIRLLLSARKDSPIPLAILVTLRIAYYHETNINREAIKELDTEINSLWSNADLNSSYVSAFMLLFEGNADRGRPLLDRHLSAGVKDPKVLSLKGWIDVVTSKDIKSAQRSFETAIAASKWPDAYFGQAKIYTDRFV